MLQFLMRDERRKEERSKQDQTNNKAKQHVHKTSMLYMYIKYMYRIHYRVTRYTGNIHEVVCDNAQGGVHG